MKSYVRLSLAALAFVLLSQFSSQDSTGGDIPAINFYGTVTDLRETFKIQNIAIGTKSDYKDIPVYQQAPLDKTIPYEPSDNVTPLSLSIVSKITGNPHQEVQKFGNRDYIVIKVFSNDAQKTEKEYLIEADKKLFCDQMNGTAGPVIKFRSIVEITIDGFKQQEPDPIAPQKKVEKPVQAAHAGPSKAKRLFSYVKNAFSGIKRNG